MLDGSRDGGGPPDGTPGHEGDIVRAMLDAVRALVVVLDPAGRIVRLNRAWEQVTGYLSDEVQGRPFSDFLLLPAESEVSQAEFARLQGGQVPSAFESRLLTKDGSRRWIAWSNTALAGDGGSVGYVVGTGIDITEQRRAEEELQRALDESRQHRAEVSALLDGARQVLTRRPFEETAHSLFDTCRDLAGAAAGYVTLSSRDGTQNELLFHDCGAQPCLTSEELPTPLRGLGEQVWRTGTAAYDNDLWSGPWASSLPEGHAVVTNMLCAPLVIGGRVMGLLGLANKPGGFGQHDAHLAMAFAEMLAISLHNSRLLNTLDAGEQRFRSVVETASAAIVTTDGRGLITFWNQKAESIFGYSAREAIGAPLTLMFPERYRDSHHEGMYRLLPTGSTLLAGETVETIGARKGGDEFPLEISLATWKTDDEGTSFTVLMQDITQRKQLEGALREARQSIEALIEASPLAILAVDLDQNVRLWNPAAERIFGWSEAEVLGQPNPLISGTTQRESLGVLAQALAGQAVSGTESVRYRKDGSPIVVNTWTAPLHDAEGSVRTVMAIMADITLRKRNEEAWRRYAREQSALYMVTSAVAGTLDQEELLPVVLHAVLPALEADAGWILLPGPHPGDPPHVMAQGGTVEGLRAGETLLPNQYCPIYHHLSASSAPLVEPGLVVNCPALAAEGVDGAELESLVCVPLRVGQHLLGVLKIGWRRADTDLEQRQDLLLSLGRQVGVALHNAQLYRKARQVDRLRSLHELDRALATTLELRTLAELTLHRVATVLGVPAASMLLLLPPNRGRLVMRLFGPAQAWQPVAGSGEQASYWQHVLDLMGDRRESMPLPDGGIELPGWDRELAHQGDAPGLAVPIWGEKAPIAVMVLAGRAFGDQDRELAEVMASHAGQAMQNAQLYDKVRRLLREQEETRARLIQAEKLSALGRLTAAIAHELNNPLQSVDSSLTLLHEELEGSRRPDKLERYLEITEEEVQRISDIVRRMHDFYRPAHERLQPTDLSAVLGSVLELSAKKLQQHEISVERTDWDSLPLIEANPDHLKQVFMSLILNAMDAMPAGGMLRLRSSPAEIETGSDTQRQPAVRIEVIDSGGGMPPEAQAKVFEPFFTTRGQSIGLGLSISYSIIEAHNGQLSVSSEEGVGTTFSILLPVAPP